jgi:hypothetical protein
LALHPRQANVAVEIAQALTGLLVMGLAGQGPSCR